MNQLDYQRALHALPRSIEPARDLWPGIAARLQTAAPTRNARGGWLPLAIAASVFGLGFVAGWQTLHQRIDWQPATLATAGPSQSWTAREAAALRVQFDAAVASGGGRARLEPQTAALRATLTELERQADQIEQAIQRSPDSTFLLERLRRLEQTRLRLSRSRFDV